MFINTANNNVSLFCVNYLNERGFYLIFFHYVKVKAWFIWETIRNIQKFHLLRILWGWIQKNNFLSWCYRLRNFSWKFWFHLKQLCQIICLCILVDTPDHQGFCSMSMHLYGRKIGSFLSYNFSACILMERFCCDGTFLKE